MSRKRPRILRDTACPGFRSVRRRLFIPHGDSHDNYEVRQIRHAGTGECRDGFSRQPVRIRDRPVQERLLQWQRRQCMGQPCRALRRAGPSGGVSGSRWSPVCASGSARGRPATASRLAARSRTAMGTTAGHRARDRRPGSSPSLGSPVGSGRQSASTGTRTELRQWLSRSIRPRPRSRWCAACRSRIPRSRVSRSIPAAADASGTTRTGHVPRTTATRSGEQWDSRSSARWDSTDIRRRQSVSNRPGPGHHGRGRDSERHATRRSGNRCCGAGQHESDARSADGTPGTAASPNATGSTPCQSSARCRRVSTGRSGLPASLSTGRSRLSASVSPGRSGIPASVSSGASGLLSGRTAVWSCTQPGDSLRDGTSGPSARVCRAAVARPELKGLRIRRQRAASAWHARQDVSSSDAHAGLGQASACRSA